MKKIKQSQDSNGSQDFTIICSSKHKCKYMNKKEIYLTHIHKQNKLQWGCSKLQRKLNITRQNQEERKAKQTSRIRVKYPTFYTFFVIFRYKNPPPYHFTWWHHLHFKSLAFVILPLIISIDCLLLHFVVFHFYGSIIRLWYHLSFYFHHSTHK